MTEPREPENVDELEVDRPERPETPAPDTGAWRPVNTEAAAEPAAERVGTVEEEPAPPVDDEPTAMVENEPEPAVGEPTAVVEHEPTAVVENEREPAVEEPTAVVEQPTVVVEHEPTAVVEHEPEPSVEEPTAVVEHEPTVVAAQPDVTDSATQRLQLEDERARQPGGPADGIFRPASPSSSPSPEPTRMEQLSDEEQKLAAERAARRDARAAALAAPAPVPLATPAPVIVHKRTNDKFWGALGLFLLRIVLAGIFAVRGLNILTDIPAAQAQFAKTVIPQPEIMAIVTGVAAELIALSLLLGLLTRFAGLGIALIAAGALVFVYWSPNWSPFVAGQPGFLGEYELLLAAVGLLLLLIGGGGWSLDRSFRAGRERDKRERANASE